MRKRKKKYWMRYKDIRRDFMGWCKEYQDELDELMKSWQKEIKDTLKKDAPKWNSAMGVGKSETVLINDRYKEKLAELKERYGI